MDAFLFFLFAAIAVACGINLVVQTHPISSALSLIGVMGSLAVLYLLLGAEFLAAAQMIVYAGAIMVLFVFVIMLLGAEKLPAQETRPEMRWQRPLAIGLGAFLLLQVGLALALPGMRAAPEPIDASPLAIGMKLFTTYLFPFEVASVLLLAAMVGAVTLTRKD